jgi:hypothetical protein
MYSEVGCTAAPFNSTRTTQMDWPVEQPEESERSAEAHTFDAPNPDEEVIVLDMQFGECTG